jgi:iron complex transport system substrate-binding protein
MFSRYFRHILLFGVLAAAGYPAAAMTLHYKDKRGRIIAIETPVKRAVIFETYELLPSIGGFDHVVGLGSYAFKDGAIRATSPEISRKIPSVGTVWNLNIEAILKVKPDLVITYRNSNDKAIEFMESKGLKVLVIYPESIAELYEVMRLEGKLFAKEREVESVISKMEAIFSLIRNRVDKIPQNKRKRVLHLMMNPTMIAGRKGISQELLDLVGVYNCADSAQNFPEVSLERIIAWNPDILYFVWYARYSAADLLNSTQWHPIKAIRDRNVFRIPNGSTWSPRIAATALWMAASAYPEIFKDLDIPKAIDQFYLDIYHVPYSKIRQLEE